MNALANVTGDMAADTASSGGSTPVTSKLMEMMQQLMTEYQSEIGTRSQAHSVLSAQQSSGTFSGYLSCSDGTSRDLSVSMTRSFSGLESNDSFNYSFWSGHPYGAWTGSSSSSGQSSVGGVSNDVYLSVSGYGSASGTVTYVNDSDSIVQSISVDITYGYDYLYSTSFTCSGTLNRQ